MLHLAKIDVKIKKFLLLMGYSTHTRPHMEETYQHKILIVDTDNDIGKSFGDILKKENIAPLFSKSSEGALKKIQTEKPRFSIIIADQNLGGTNGSEFLEQAKKLSPFSSLFLMSDHADTQSIVNAVNLDIIQRYVAKPLNKDHFMATIKSGLKSYEFFIENKRLMILAKKQNSKLYELDCELMEATKTHTKTLLELDEEIAQIEKNIQRLSDRPEIKPDLLTDKIKAAVKKENSIKPEHFNELFCKTILELYRQFNDMAYRNGFEIAPVEELTGEPEKDEGKK